MSEITVPFNDRLAGPYVATEGQTVFDYDFPIATAAELHAVRRRSGVETVLVTPQHFSVQDAGEQEGGTITLVTGATAGDVIAIYGALAPERITDFQLPPNSPSSTDFNVELDRLAKMLQQLQTRSNRSIRLLDTDEAADLRLPLKADRSSKLMAFDAAGLPTVIDELGGVAIPTLDLFSYVNTGTGAISRTALDKLRETGFWLEDYGAIRGDSSANAAGNAAAFNKAVAAARLNGGGIIKCRAGIWWFDVGIMVLDNTGASFLGHEHVSLEGAGSAFCKWKFTGTSTNGVGLKLLGTSINGGLQNSVLQGVHLFGLGQFDYDQTGLHAEFGSIIVRDVFISQWRMGAYEKDLVGAQWDSVWTQFCRYGLQADGTSSTISEPNEMVWINCHWMQCYNYGALLDIANANVFIGGSFEGCGRDGADLSRWALKIQHSGLNGNAIQMYGTHFEGTSGVADIWISHTNIAACAYSFTDVDFYRNSATYFSTNNIRLDTDGDSGCVVNVRGGTFAKRNDYVEDVSRKYIAEGTVVGTSHKWNIDNPIFESAVAVPTVAGTINYNGQVGIGGFPLTKQHIHGGSLVPGGELGAWMVSATDPAYRIIAGYDQSNVYGWLQSLRAAVSPTELRLNPLGGLVSLGAAGVVSGQLGWYGSTSGVAKIVAPAIAGTPTLTLPLQTGLLPVQTATPFTAGSVVFSGALGVYDQDNANFFWDNANNRLGLLTASPVTTFHVLGGSVAPAGELGAFALSGATAAKRLTAGVDTSGTMFAWLQSIEAGVSARELALQPLGGAPASFWRASAPTAGGSTVNFFQMGSTVGFGIYFGFGAPTITAAQGSIYLRSDGSSTSTRAYINTNGGTTWTAITTAA